MDYMGLYTAIVGITRTKRPNTHLGPSLTTLEHHQRDELIMAQMYGLEMLRQNLGARPCG